MEECLPWFWFEPDPNTLHFVQSINLTQIKKQKNILKWLDIWRYLYLIWLIRASA